MYNAWTGVGGHNALFGGVNGPKPSYHAIPFSDESYVFKIIIPAI